MKTVTIKETDDFDMKDEWWGVNYPCPNCGIKHIWNGFNYCPECGVKIKWIGIDERDKIRNG